MFMALLAHIGDGSTSFGTGFMHPIRGLDHLLAMIAVGFLSARMAAKHMWMLPAAFVVSMALGGLLGLVIAPEGSAAVEWGIVASVLVLGLFIAIAPRVNVVAGNVIVAAFAICHGHAHIAEMADASFAGYFTGMLLATALLHMAGLIAGVVMIRHVGNWIIRLAGAALATGFLIALVMR